MGTPPRYFLLVSNMRCGSTLLQFMIGELGDTATDYEVKWKPSYTPHDIHLVIDYDTVSMKMKLADIIAPHAICGSKLVFDPVCLPEADYARIATLIDPDIQIIHIKRPYWEILLSSMRGFLHLPTQDKDMSGSKAYKILLALKDPQTVLAKSNGTDQHLPSFADCIKQYRILLRNDLEALRLRQNHSYMLVRYARIAQHFPKICRFLGSEEPLARIRNIVAAPPLHKLPAITLHEPRLKLRLAGRIFDSIFWLNYAIIAAKQLACSRKHPVKDNKLNQQRAYTA